MFPPPGLTNTSSNSQPTHSTTSFQHPPAFPYPYPYVHYLPKSPHAVPSHLYHLSTPSSSSSIPSVPSPDPLFQERLFQSLPWYPPQQPPTEPSPDQLSDNEQVDDTRKRQKRNQGNRGRRRRRTMAVPTLAKENDSALDTPEPPAHFSAMATADVCGVGLIPNHTQRPPSPSKNPALNSRIFHAMAKKTGRGSTNVASDVWYNICPCDSKQQPSMPLPHYKMDKKRPKVQNAPFLACRFCM